jgi:two-component system, OmpR family, clock-associated histidine kinase SasA
MQVLPELAASREVPLQLLLFVDRRPTSREQIRQIRSLLEDLGAEASYELKVIDVGEQPYLAEHFRLIATPTLIKLFPEPQQMLAGSDLIPQLRSWWPRWQQHVQDAVLLEDELAKTDDPLFDDDLTAPESSPTAVVIENNEHSSLVHATKVLQLADEIFLLQREKEAQRAQLKFKDQIIAMLAHDLRNPLTAASIAMETLDMGFHPKEGQVSRLTPKLIAQLLRQGRSQLKTIDGMITDILQAAHGTSAGLKIDQQPLQLADLCATVLEDFNNRLAGKGVIIETDIPSDIPLVYIDAEKIRQVLNNLLDNAIKYTSDSGKVQISVFHRTSQKVQVSLCDNGFGIPENDRKHIFEDHFRLHRDQAQSGYGMGLYLCQRIIRAHYGQIWVDSTIGQGSCFHFTLPVYRG